MFENAYHKEDDKNVAQKIIWDTEYPLISVVLNGMNAAAVTEA